ncbi:MAG: flagellar assembly protein FliW [Lachnospiraceae bacterium]|nr:flagellar assembly protein FliW [Lachnospiraceae bacterium]
MKVSTRIFGEIELDDDKVITFEQGMLGLTDLKKFTLLYNTEEDGTRPSISWLQSLDEPGLAFPVIIPTLVYEDYNPIVDDELIAPLGELGEENLTVLVTVTVSPDITQMTTNLKAPIIINSDTRKGCQVIAENPDYEIKYKIYEKLNALKEQKGGC